MSMAPIPSDKPSQGLNIDTSHEGGNLFVQEGADFSRKPTMALNPDQTDIQQNDLEKKHVKVNSLASVQSDGAFTANV